MDSRKRAATEAILKNNSAVSTASSGNMILVERVMKVGQLSSHGEKFESFRVSVSTDRAETTEPNRALFPNLTQ